MDIPNNDLSAERSTAQCKFCVNARRAAITTASCKMCILADTAIAQATESSSQAQSLASLSSSSVGSSLSSLGPIDMFAPLYPIIREPSLAINIIHTIIARELDARHAQLKTESSLRTSQKQKEKVTPKLKKITKITLTNRTTDPTLKTVLTSPSSEVKPQIKLKLKLKGKGKCKGKDMDKSKSKSTKQIVLRYQAKDDKIWAVLTAPPPQEPETVHLGLKRSLSQISRDSGYFSLGEPGQGSPSKKLKSHKDSTAAVAPVPAAPCTYHQWWAAHYAQMKAAKVVEALKAAAGSIKPEARELYERALQRATKKFAEVRAAYQALKNMPIASIKGVSDSSQRLRRSLREHKPSLKVREKKACAV